MASWKDIQEGYGLEEVPRELDFGYQCIFCPIKTRKQKLYTTESLKYSETRKSLDELEKRLRKTVMCKYHAKRYYDY